MAKKSPKPKPRTLLEKAEPPAPRLVPAPVKFSDILGQDRALSILSNAIRSERVHHAWIFHGPSGVGKFTAALAFAALLLDDSTKATKSGHPEAHPTVKNGSRVQQLLAAGTHPDLHVITKELARFSDDAQVRERKLITIPRDVIDTHLIAPALLASAMPGGLASKVFIIDEAELLDRSPNNAPTQNAILKTLEEPPPGTVIILVTTSPDSLLTTIRSRSQQVAFAPLNDAAMKEWLESRRKDIDPPVGALDLPFLQSFAAGAPGEFLRAHLGGLAEWSRTLEPLLAQADSGKYALALGPTMAKLIDDWAAAQVAKDKQLSKDSMNRAGAELMFRLLSQRARHQLRKNPASPERALAAIATIREAERELDAAVNAQFVMEWLSTQLSGKRDAMLV